MIYAKTVLAITLLLLTTSCSTTNYFKNEPVIEPIAVDKLAQLKPPQQKVVVAVYEFYDLTGQRKSKGNIALFSTAVSQGSSNWLIKALKDAGRGTWFTVVERTFLDNLIQDILKD